MFFGPRYCIRGNIPGFARHYLFNHSARCGVYWSGVPLVARNRNLIIGGPGPLFWGVVPGALGTTLIKKCNPYGVKRKVVPVPGCRLRVILYLRRHTGPVTWKLMGCFLLPLLSVSRRFRCSWASRPLLPCAPRFALRGRRISPNSLVQLGPWHSCRLWCFLIATLPRLRVALWSASRLDLPAREVGRTPPYLHFLNGSSAAFVPARVPGARRRWRFARCRANAPLHRRLYAA